MQYPRTKNKKVLEDVIPSPKKPSSVVAYDKDGKVINFKEEWPKGTERIVDYSAGKPGGLDHFYSQLNLTSLSHFGRVLANIPNLHSKHSSHGTEYLETSTCTGLT